MAELAHFCIYGWLADWAGLLGGPQSQLGGPHSLLGGPWIPLGRPLRKLGETEEAAALPSCH